MCPPGPVSNLFKEYEPVSTTIEGRYRESSIFPAGSVYLAADSVARSARELGAQYYGIHTTCRKAAEALDRYREDGSLIRGETCTHYTTLTGDLHEELGNLPRIAPPFRNEDNVDAILEALRAGPLSVVSTDHVAQKWESKEESEWWEGPFGANGLQVSLPVFHDVAVNERGLSYGFLSRVMSRNPAATFGLPNKGTLDPRLSSRGSRNCW